MWQASNDKITWLNMPDKASAMHHRYVREMLDELPPPIPEPAPELCAFQNCGRDRSHSFHYPCPDSFNCNVQNCHSFVFPQAKPVLREPKPWPNGLPDICLKCRGDKGPHRWMCSVCWTDSPADLATGYAWDALHRKPAVKDIPSPETARPFGGDTEAARGGEAAISREPRQSHYPFRPLSERGRSAVAAAPGIEPWRPSVDDWDLLADAETGWRR